MIERDPIRDRYHHGDLRQAVLDAACQHLRHDTTDTLSLRALARQIGVSQTAPYRHFDSKNSLFAAIATWGFRILKADILSAMESTEGETLSMLIEMGTTYLTFAQDHYEKYQLFFDSSLVEFSEYPELQQAGSDCFDIMLQSINRGVEEGLLVSEPGEKLAAIIWSGLHGAASLQRIHYLRDGFSNLPVGQAVMYLATRRREVVTILLRSVQRVSR